MLKWYGDEVINKFEKEMDSRNEEIAEMLTQKAKEGIREGLFPYPKSRTGNLVNSIGVQKLGDEWRWGSDLLYSKILELSLNRPWLTTTNKDNIRNMKNIYEREIR